MKAPKKLIVFALATLVAGTYLSQAQAQTVFYDPFDSQPHDNGWVPDRKAPAVFASVVDPTNTPGHGNVLQLSLAASGLQTDGFYNTQGYKHSASVAGPWTVSADLYVSQAMLNNNGTHTGDHAFAFDLWARNGVSGNDTGANYPFIGITNFNDDGTSAFGPARFEIFSANTSLVPLDVIAQPGWYHLAVSNDATGYNFYVDGNLVYRDATAEAPNLTDVFLNAYNTGNDETFLADNVRAEMGAVPEPSTYAMILGVGLTGLVVWGKRRRSPLVSV